MLFEKELLCRFIKKIKVKESQCWEWIGCFSGSQSSYPYFRYDGAIRRAHRFSYRYFKGVIPDNLTVNHDCNNKKCVNPNHLSLMTIQQNIKLRKPRAIPEKMFCFEGHPLLGDNLYTNPKGSKQCQICKKGYAREYYSRRKRLYGS